MLPKFVALCYNKHMGRVIALDIGDVRVGIATSDIMKIIANPLQTYKRTGDDQRDAQYIADIVKTHDCDTLVSGLPRNLKGEETIQTAKTRDFAEKVGQLCGLKVIYIDERLTTVTAQRVLLDANVSRKNRKEVVDKVAATVILQTYLDSNSR